MLLSIIIPVFNQWALTAQCLESLKKTTPGDDFEVIVVDNGSTDETAREAPLLGNSLFGNRFKHLRSEVNLNFGPGCNLGARNSTGRLLFFLNNDTILTPEWLPPLLQELERDLSLGAVGPLLLFPAVGPLRDRVQHLGIAFEPQFYPHHLYEYFPANHPVIKKQRRYQALTGAALLLPRDLFMATGLFDEAFINGGEDVELGLRICRRGHTLTCVPSSMIYHLASQTPGRHEHEQHNAILLKERAVGSICPDLHLRLSNDGYVPGLTPWLKWHANIQKKRKEMYACQVQRKKDSLEIRQVLSTMLNREPMWIEGYRQLARLEEAAGDTTKALALLFIASKLYHHPDSFLPLLRLAAKAGDNTMENYADGNIRWFTQCNSYEYFKDVATEMRDFYARVSVKRLETLYKDWLTCEEQMRIIFKRYRSACEVALASRRTKHQENSRPQGSTNSLPST